METAHASAFHASGGHATHALLQQLDAHALTRTSNSALNLSHCLSLCLCQNPQETTHGPVPNFAPIHQTSGPQKLPVSHLHSGSRKLLVNLNGNNHQPSGNHNHPTPGNHSLFSHHNSGFQIHHKTTHGSDHSELKMSKSKLR